LGPRFWNLIFDNLLAELRTSATECEPIAYVDDIVILVVGNARKELQRKEQEVVTRVSNWCAGKKPTLLVKKTEATLAKDDWIGKDHR
jgi:hypothetical protein